MNISAHVCLAFLVTGICVISSAYSDPLVTKTYIIKGFKGLAGNSDSYAVAMVIADDGYEYPESRSVLNSADIPELNKLKDFHPKVVTIDQVPLDGLLSLVHLYPELLPQALPALLSNSNPEVVAKHVSADLFRALTAEDKKLISPDDLAALEKLYEDKKLNSPDDLLKQEELHGLID